LSPTFARALQALTRHLTKWESKLYAAADADAATNANAETEFLDFLQYYYWTLLCELQYEAVRFARVHVPLFHDALAGRQVGTAMCGRVLLFPSSSLTSRTPTPLDAPGHG
jgi:hypothetical protein